ncbi:SAM-dependent methyltransferase [Azospirillum sp.]|uniref:SAM-dependent methyltransferase n=1 Tax=Azospirillum sp. TaxID=34012 RepID=UPI002D24E09C|nr:SAM-dependent methyltransferase [Azospirillum sp.]HYD71010.1 SAM-dependent methyltransferase [Azospirillum sp.]
MEPLGQTIYLAPEGFVDDLVAELGEVSDVQDRLVFAPGPARPAAWAQNVWFDPVKIEVESIKDAAKKLRGIQRNWALWSIRHHRRASLIQENLPHVSAKPVPFPSPLPGAPLGSWTLWDERTVIAAARCSSPFRHGEVAFVENKTAPPNRAYLKLWEALTLSGAHPGPGDRCIDLGSSPGGWTWVLHELGATVVSVDKAPLDPAITALPRVEFRQESAFGLKPEDVGPVDWLCCDVICYPQRLLRLVEAWRASGLAKRFICTLKFQAETDHETARAFAAIPGGRLVHLYHNKHELTWIWPAA